MKLRQVAIAAETLNPARGQLFDLLGITDDFADPGVAEFGLENSVMALGDNFLEIVAPTQANTSAGRLLAKRKQTCGYMVLIQVDNFAQLHAQLEKENMRTIWQVDRPEVSACHVHPKDIGGAIVSFDEMSPPADWLWAGPNWREQRASNVSTLLGCELQHPQPLELANRWAAVMALAPVSSADKVQLQFADGSFIDFVEAPLDRGITGITFACKEPETLATNAQELGLWCDKRNGVFIGDVALQFYPTTF